MARKHVREPKVDTELAYAYAKTDRLHDMEDFLALTNVADILEVGEKCFEDELYQAAKLLFTSISNWARLATTLIYLGENQGAVESARKAGNTQYVIFCTNRNRVLMFLVGFGSKFMRLAWRRANSDWYVHHRLFRSYTKRFRRLKFAVSTSSSMLKSFPPLCKLMNARVTSMRSCLSLRLV